MDFTECNRLIAELAEERLREEGLFDIDAFGWRNADEVDEEYVGYAMWTLTPPYEHDVEAWLQGTPPTKEPSQRDQRLMEWGHDFFGLMKASRYFIGCALLHKRGVPILQMEPVAFDCYEFAALTALIAAADRMRDFLIVACLGQKTNELDQLDRSYALLSELGMSEHERLIRETARELRAARNARQEVIHRLATVPARTQRHLIDDDRAAYLKGERESPYAVPMRDLRDEEEAIRTSVEERARLLCAAYSALVRLGHASFVAEYDLRRLRGTNGSSDDGQTLLAP